MPQHYSSGFEAAVGGFLQGYGTVRGMRRENAEDARREREARQASRMREIQMAESGYQEVDFTVPTVEPRRNFIQSIGHKLRGSPEPERDVRLLKMGPSASERLAAQNREFQIADREDTQAHAATGWAREDARAVADRAARATEAEASRRTQLGVAGIYAGASQRADARANAETDREQRDQFLNELAAATNGNPRAMMGLVEARPDLMAKARRWKIPGFAYSAAANAFQERKRLNDATVIGRTQEKSEAPRVRRSEGNNTGVVPDVAQQQAAWDRAAAALRAQGKDPAEVIGPRP